MEETIEEVSTFLNNRGIDCTDLTDDDKYLAYALEDGYNLLYIPNRLKTKELYHYAISNTQSDIIKDLSIEELTYEYCRIGIISSYGRGLQFIPHQFKTLELCLLAVNLDGYNLHYVSTNIRTLEICLSAVRSYKFALFLLTDEERTEEVYNEALKYFPDLAQYQRIINYTYYFELENILTKEDYNLLQFYYNVNWCGIEGIPLELRTNELYRIAIRQNDYDELSLIEEELTPDVFTLWLNETNGNAMYNISKEFMTDEICKLAIKLNGVYISFIPEDKRTEELWSLAIETSKFSIFKLPKERRTLKLLVKVIKKYPELQNYFIKNNPDKFWKDLFMLDKDILKIMPREFITLELLAFKALKTLPAEVF